MTTDATTRRARAAAALAPQAAEDPQVLTSVTDEEILALTGDGLGFDLPWVTARESRAEGFSRDEARWTATRSLISRGLLAPEAAVAQIEQREVDGDPASWTPNILLTGIIARRMLVPLQIRADGPTTDRVSIASMFVDHDGTVLQELISPDGIHHFTMSDATRAASVLRHRVDPGGHAGDSSAGGVVRGTLAELEAVPGIGASLAPGASRTRVRLSDRRDRSEASLLVASGPAGVVVVRDLPDGADQFEATSATAAELDEFVTSFFTVEDLG